jgi:hypothetical protein
MEISHSFGPRNWEDIDIDIHSTKENEKHLIPSKWSYTYLRNTIQGLKDTALLLSGHKDLTQIIKEHIERQPHAYLIEYNLFFMNHVTTPYPQIANKILQYARGGSSEPQTNVWQNIFQKAFSIMFNGGKTLFVCSQEEHPRLAQPVQKSLETSDKYLPSIIRVIESVSKTWLKDLENKTFPDVDTDCYHISTGSIARIAVGHQGPYPLLYIPAKEIEESIFDVIVKKKPFNEDASKRMDEMLRSAKSSCDTLNGNQELQDIQNKEIENSLLYHLNDDIEQKLTEDEIWNTIKFLFFAGISNAASLLRSGLYVLSQDQVLQDKLCQEIVQALENNSELTFNYFFANIPQLETAYYKFLREKPPVPLIGRSAGSQGVTLNIKKDGKIIEQHFLENGDYFNYAAFYAGKDARVVGEKTENLNLEEEKKLFKLLGAFSMGPEACPAQMLVKKQTLLFYASLLLQFKFECDQKEMPFIFQGSLRPKEKLQFKLSKRNPEIANYYQIMLNLKCN